ncbi:MAG: glycosyltransferase [Thomasclavelia sp.]
MISDKIVVKNGTLLEVNNIEENNDLWEFKNNDPQIIIEFSLPQKGVRIKFNFKENVEKDFNAVVYYRKEAANFTEDNKLTFSLLTLRECVHEIHFFDEVTEIRLDIHDENDTVLISRIEVETLDVDDNIATCLSKNIYRYENKSNGENIVILGHDLSSTGASILAFNIAKKLKKSGKNVVMLVRQHTVSFLLEKYEEEKIPIIFLDDNRYNFSNIHICLNYQRIKQYAKEEYLRLILEMLRINGFSSIITNTVVAGEFVKTIKEFNFKIISLIHEMKTTIQLYGFYDYGENIAKYSDYTVFPDDSVKKSFEELYSSIRGMCCIRPQGIYLKKDVNINIDNYDFNDYGFSKNDLIIMNSGTCELRKGIDLFLSSAIILNQISNKKIHYVWTGNFGLNRELEGWIYNQVEKSGLKEYFHIIPFIENQDKYRTLLSNVDIFWSTSREDPFPSVVLEALNYNIPVVGFLNAGGINTILAEERGFLVENFDVMQMAKITKKLIEEQTNIINKKSIESFLDTLKFDDYIAFLTDLVHKEKLIESKLDLIRYAKCSKKHYYELQLPNKSIEEKHIYLNSAIKK